MWAALFALTAAVVWGWAYPLIKLGFQEMQITPDLTGSKVLFAGIRFTISGIIILAIARLIGKPFSIRKCSDWWYIFVFTMFNTTLHYAFFYIGLSHAPGASSAIINSLSVFTVVIASTLLFKDDAWTMNKRIGVVLGICSIFVLNTGSASGGRFTFMGEGMIILNALCGATASLLTRGLNQRVNVFVGTGYSLAFGGLLLIVYGLLLDGTLPRITPLGIFYLVLLIGISTIGFTLYNKLLTCNPVSKIAIYNSLIPVVGAMTSCIFLNETFYWKYVVAALLSATGIYLINRRSTRPGAAPRQRD